MPACHRIIWTLAMDLRYSMSACYQITLESTAVSVNGHDNCNSRRIQRWLFKNLYGTPITMAARYQRVLSKDGVAPSCVQVNEFLKVLLHVLTRFGRGGVDFCFRPIWGKESPLSKVLHYTGPIDRIHVLYRKDLTLEFVCYMFPISVPIDIS